MKIRPTGRPRIIVAREPRDQLHPVSLTSSGTRWLLTKQEALALANELADLLAGTS